MHRLPRGGLSPGNQHRGLGEGDGADSFFRSSNPNEREERLATGLVDLCNFGISACEIYPLAEDPVFERNVCDEYPYEESLPAPAASSEP